MRNNINVIVVIVSGIDKVLIKKTKKNLMEEQQ